MTTEHGPGELEEVWARRAAELAQPLPEEEVSRRLDLVVVRLGDELYGLEAQYVTGLQPVKRITRVPRVPVWVAGIVNLHGRVLSVLDLAAWQPAASQGVQRAGSGSEAALVVVETPALEVALLVDQVLAVEPVPVAALHERRQAGDLEPALPAAWIRGVYARRSDTRDVLVLVLDLPSLLSDPRLIIDEHVA